MHRSAANTALRSPTSPRHTLVDMCARSCVHGVVVFVVADTAAGVVADAVILGVVIVVTMMRTMVTMMVAVVVVMRMIAVLIAVIGVGMITVMVITPTMRITVGYRGRRGRRCLHGLRGGLGVSKGVWKGVYRWRVRDAAMQLHHGGVNGRTRPRGARVHQSNRR